jgi:molecular chaperone GrpE (heat shock protein)
MVEEMDTAKKRVIELELALEEEKSLSQARNKLLEANIKELNEVYDALREKLIELRRRNEKRSEERRVGSCGEEMRS